MRELTRYAGRWVALAGDGSVVAAGDTALQARQLAAEATALSRPQVVWVSPHPPHITLPAWPLDELRRLLPEHGVWLAGGAVRDILMNRVPHDWDLVVSGSGLDLGRSVANAFTGAYYPLDQERKTGRAIVNDPESGARVTLDFATLRGPDIIADLQGRDFTVNAMALTLDGELVDPTGGRQDLLDRQLRMTHSRCFQDDHARLLRAVRLGTALGLALESGTRNRIRDEAASIVGTAPERVRAELVMLLAQPDAPSGLSELAALDLLPHVLPEIALGTGDTLARTVALLTHLGQVLALIAGRPTKGSEADSAPTGWAVPIGWTAQPDWAWTALSGAFACTQSELSDYLAAPINADVCRGDLIRWAALFLANEPSAAPTIHAGDGAAIPGDTTPRERLAANRLTHLRFSRAAVEFVSLIVARADSFSVLARTATCGGPNSSAVLGPDRRNVYRYFRETHEAGIAIALLSLASTLAQAGARLDRVAWQHRCNVVRALTTAYFSRRDELVDPVPILTGDDLMGLGIPQGPAVGRAIEQLREAQAIGEVSSMAEAQALARRFLSRLDTGGVGTC